MWKKKIKILPKLILYPIFITNHFFSKFFFNLKKFEIGNNTFGDRDVHNLQEKINPLISFTKEEEIKGKEILEKLGLPRNAKFVCLIVRDSGYLNGYLQNEDTEKWNYHSYRNGDIDRYVMAAEELASRGYYVFRMGINVIKPLKSSNNKIIDYANSGVKSDFMDIYLGAKCFFCISTGCGFDAVPVIFRRPIAYVIVPVATFFTNNKNTLLLTKHHINKLTKKKLSITEIFSSNVGIADSIKFKDNNIELQENTPEEIRDLVIEMDDRLNEKWHETDEDILLQKFFWASFKKNINNFHQEYSLEIKAKFSAKFLRNNKNFIN